MEVITKKRYDQINQIYESMSVYRSVIFHEEPIDDLIKLLKTNDYPINDRMYIYGQSNNIEWNTINFIICIGEDIFRKALDISSNIKFQDNVIIIKI